jgi:hypothetical protein
VAGSVLGVVMTAVVVAVVVRYASRNPEDANLGPKTFRFRAERLAREIDERGPFLLKDPLDRGRDVYVQHLGQDAEAGWLAVRAYASKVSVNCLLRWEPEPGRFIDPCTGHGYAPDGEGLVTYPATVRDGTVSVDLRASGQ